MNPVITFPISQLTLKQLLKKVLIIEISIIEVYKKQLILHKRVPLLLSVLSHM